MYTSTPIVTKDVGTVCYAAPELLMQGLLTRAADVYSYGARSYAQHRYFCQCHPGPPAAGSCSACAAPVGHCSSPPLCSHTCRLRLRTVAERDAGAGSILWSMWTGQVPWSGFSDAQIVAAVSQRRRLHIPASTPPEYQVLTTPSARGGSGRRWTGRHHLAHISRHPAACCCRLDWLHPSGRAESCQMLAASLLSCAQARPSLPVLHTWCAVLRRSPRPQALMQQCLRFDYERRPTFKQIVTSLEQQLTALDAAAGQGATAG